MSSACTASGSTVGMLLCGLLAIAEVNPAIATTFQATAQAVSLAGSAGQFMNQLIGVVFTVALSAHRQLTSL